MGRAEVEGSGGDRLQGFFFGRRAGEPGFHESFSGGRRFRDFGSGGEAGGGFEGDLGAFALGEAGLEIGLAEEFWSGCDAPVDEGHHEEAPAAGIADGPSGFTFVDRCDSFERAEAGDPAAVDLGKGLGGGNSDAGAVVASGAGSYDDRGEMFSSGKLGEDQLKRAEEVAFLGSFAGKIPAGGGLAIASEREGGVGDAGFDGEDPFVGHGGSLDGPFVLSN